MVRRRIFKNYVLSTCAVGKNYILPGGKGMSLKTESTKKAEGLGHRILTWTFRYGVEGSICDKCGAIVCIQSDEPLRPDIPYIFGRAVTKQCRG